MASLASHANGSQKKKTPLLIFKQERMPKDKMPQIIFIHVHSIVLMDKDGMKLELEKWGKTSWCPIERHPF
jgi:hypothetical protein